MVAIQNLVLGLLLLCRLDGAFSGSIRGNRELRRKRQSNGRTSNGRMGNGPLDQSPIVYPSSINSGRVIPGNPVLTQLADGTITFLCNGVVCDGATTAAPTPENSATLAPGNNTVAPGNNTGTNTTGTNTTRSGGGLGLDLSDLTADQNVNVLTVNCQLKFEFFTGTGAEPTTGEIDSVVAETKAFFDGVFGADATFSGSFQSFTMENITPKFSDGESDDVFELDFSALVGATSTSLSNQDAANTMSGADFKTYISNFVWETPPLKRSQFYDTHVVTFIATGTARF